MLKVQPEKFACAKFIGCTCCCSRFRLGLGRLVTGLPCSSSIKSVVEACRKYSSKSSKSADASEGTGAGGGFWTSRRAAVLALADASEGTGAGGGFSTSRRAAVLALAWSDDLL